MKTLRSATDPETARRLEAVPHATLPGVRFAPVLDVARGVLGGVETSLVDVPPAALSTRLTDVFDHARRRPANTFLLTRLPASADHLRAARGALLRQSDLRGFIFDLGEADLRDGHATDVIGDIRGGGGLIALSGQHGSPPLLRALSGLTPLFLRLGRDWVRDIDTTSARRRSLLDVGRLAGDLDCWLMADEVHTVGELNVLHSLGVPLVSGPVLGHAGHSDWPTVDYRAVVGLGHRRPVEHGPLRDLLRVPDQVFTAADAEQLLRDRPEVSHAVVIDSEHRPTAVAVRSGDAVAVGEPLCVNVDTPLEQMHARARARVDHRRAAPVVVIDNAGRLLGTVPAPR